MYGNGNASVPLPSSLPRWPLWVPLILSVESSRVTAHLKSMAQALSGPPPSPSSHHDPPLDHDDDRPTD